MWILTKQETDERLILLPNKEYTVGRVNTDLVLSNDLCISRNHAVLYVLKAEIPKLELEDSGSKYGTFHNEGIATNKPIGKNMRLPIQDGDKIRFGVLKNIWHVKHFKITTLASALTGPQNQQLEKVMTALGGEIVNSWCKTCTHLTMNELSVTVKLLQTLLEQLPVVTINYWIELFKLAKSGMFKGSLPVPENFAPRHSTDMDLSKRANRQKLFQGKTFVFMHRKPFEMYAPIITKASGTCKDLNTGVKKAFLTKENVVVIQFVPPSQSQATETINTITGILEQSSLRIIPEYEIGLAIIHCSTEKYCNPKFKQIQDTVSTEENNEKNFPTCSVYAENTAEEAQSEGNLNAISEVIVPETEGTNKDTCNSNNKMEPIVIDSDDNQDETEPPANKRKPSISITESDVEEPSQLRKRKRLTRRRQVLYDTDEDDDGDEVFQCNKIPRKNVEEKNEESDKPARRISPRKKQQEVPTINESTKTSETLANSSLTIVKRTRNETANEKKGNTAKKIKITIESLECEPSTSSKNDSPLKTPRKLGTKKTKPVSELTRNTQSTTEDAIDSLSNKRPSLPDKGFSANKTTPSRMKPLPMTQSRNISLAGFLEKSQNPALNGPNKDVNSESSSNTGGALVTRKCTVISVIRESDDEDDLFNFGDTIDTQVAKKSRKSAVVEEQNSDDELFGFKETNQNKDGQVKNPDEGDDEDLIETEPYQPSFKSTGSSYAVIKPRPLPSKVSINGWLSCGMKTENNNIKTKDETIAEQKEQTSNDEASMTDEHTKWLNTLVNGIEVRISSLCVSSIKKATATDEVDAPKEQMETIGNQKNFKKFVKNRVLHPQTRIIKVVPYCPNVRS